MKKLIQFAVVMSIMGVTTLAQARDTAHYLSVQEALNSSEAKQILDPNVEVVFGSSKGQVIKQNLISNRKTNAFGKSDEQACRWAFLSAVKQFQEQAIKNNAHKVVNLMSYYKKNTYSKNGEYECHAGALMAGVTLKGDIAR